MLNRVLTLTSNWNSIRVDRQVSDGSIVQDVTPSQADTTVSESYSNHRHVLMNTEGMDLHKKGYKIHQNNL